MRRIVAIFFIASLACLGFRPDRPARVFGQTGDRSEVEKAEQAPDTDKKNLVVGPGEVRFSFTRNGEWIGLYPSWHSGRSMFDGGGIIIFSINDAGEVVMVANSAAGELEEKVSPLWGKKFSEGVAGGARAPALKPDDDEDGRINEDRLDGVDNDNDGRIDEDFAAIGDEMVVTEYKTKSGTSPHRLLFHQESFGWSMPHIDEIIPMRLVIENVGDTPLERPRLGVVIGKQGPFRFTERTFERTRGGNKSVEEARALLCGENNGAHVALMIFRTTGETQGGWMSGIMPWGEIRFNGMNSNATRSKLARHEAGDRGEKTAREDETRNAIQVDDGNTVYVYALSPELNTVPPGGKMEFSLALVSARTPEEVDAALANAYKTCIGDGKHAFLPPPVSISCRTLWGEYRKLPEAAGGGVTISIENAEAEGVRPGNISLLSGVALSRLERPEFFGGTLTFVYREKIQERYIDETNGRIVLKGRLKSGDIFEVVLSPADSESDLSVDSLEDADEYWSIPKEIKGDFLRCSPNPFRESTTISYEIPSSITDENGNTIFFSGPFEASVKIYNVAGRLISVLADGILGPSTQDVTWNAVDDYGKPVASGVYYVRFQIEKRFLTKRLILLK